MSSEVKFDFDEEQRPEYNRSGSKLVKVVVKLSGGRIDEARAIYVLLGVAILSFVISLFLFPGGVNKNVSPIKDTIPFSI